MAAVKEGDTVKIHYEGKLEDGTVFDTSRESEPLTIKIGSSQTRLPSAIEEHLVGLNTGEKKQIDLDPENAYGTHREELVLQVPKENLSDDFKPEVGQYFHIEQENSSILVKVLEIAEDTVTLDANHPLAGRKLAYAIELVSVDP